MLEFSDKFVCATRERCTVNNHVNAPVMRKSFVLKAKPEKAEILICGLGFYDLFVNGEKITKGYIAPYVSNPDDIIYYDLYDIAEKLTEGENVIGVVLGNGLNNPMTKSWDFYAAVYSCSPRVAFSFKAECGDETSEFDATGMKCKESPITFDNFHYGVRYDARLEEDGWCSAGFDDSGWRDVIAAEKPRGYARLCMAEPCVVKEELAPVSVRAGELDKMTWNRWYNGYHDGYPEDPCPLSGGYLYDFGKNTAGIFRFKIKNARPGQEISFQCGEYLTDEGKLTYTNIKFFPDGYVQRDIYTCRGGAEEEIFVPMFTYHGTRYIYVYGIDEEQATSEALTFLVMYSDIEKRAYFNCSNETANKLFEAITNSNISNFHYYPTDCPHREKNGWTGDAATSSEHMILTLSVENSWREWMNNIRAAQNEAGEIPGIVPTAGWGFKWGNGPAWDRVMFDLPYMAYIYRGETDMIKENRHMMMRYLDLMASRIDSDGLVFFGHENGLGDWVPVGTTNSAAYQTSFVYTDNVMVYDMCRKAEMMFNAVGSDLNAAYAKALGERIRMALREKFIDFGSMTTVCRSQTGQAMAIYYGIFDEGEMGIAAKKLVELIKMSDGDFEGGYLGIRVIFHVLAMYGEFELAYNMIMKDSFPSYAYYINMGFTSLPEVFCKSKDMCLSHNHHFLGDVNHFFMRHVLGINVNPYCDDPNRIIIKPIFACDLDFAEGSYEAPGGRLEVKWSREGENVRLCVKNDESIKVEIRLPDGYMLGEDDFYRTWIKGGNKELLAIPRRNHYR